MANQDEDYQYTIAAFIEAIQILAKYAKDGLQTTFFLEAEHDQIWADVSGETLPPDYEDAKRLKELGWHLDADINYWFRFT